MKNQTSFNNDEKNLEMNLTLLIPYKLGKEVSDSEIYEIEKSRDHRNCDMIGSFSGLIIASLERRMAACQNNLISHTSDITYNDGCRIVWKRKNGSRGYFNVPSFKNMQDCVKALEQGCQKTVLNNPAWIDQILKALLNDTEQDHSDKGGFCYSELISLLTEIHMFGVK